MKAAHVLATAAVLAAAGVVISLVLAFQPGPGADAGPGAASPAAGSRAIVPPTSGSSATAGSLILAAGPAIATRPPATRPPAAWPSAKSLSAKRSSAKGSSAAPSTPAASAGAASAGAPSAGAPSAGAPSAGAPLAGRIKPGVTYQGVATEYSAGNGDGACLFGPASDLMIAAMNYTDYDTASACGDYVMVQAADGASVKVLITNECPLPCAPGQIDLSQQAFAEIANPTAGRIPITWKLLSPSMSSTVSIRYKVGSSRWWCAIQVIGHRNPVALLEVRASNGWQQLPRTSYNYFLSAGGGGCGGPIRITDIYGQQLTINGIALLPDVIQPTQLQFSQH